VNINGTEWEEPAWALAVEEYPGVLQKHGKRPTEEKGKGNHSGHQVAIKKRKIWGGVKAQKHG